MTSELTEVSVEKLGLVTNGANQETFFLLKSAANDTATVSNENATATVSQPDQQEIQIADEVTKSVWQRITNLFKQALEPEHQAEVLAEIGVEKAVCAPEEAASDPEKEDDEEEEQPVMKSIKESPMSEMEMVAKAQYDLLAVTVTDLQTRLAKAEQVAEDARDASTLQAYIAKADALVALPISALDLGTNLHQLAKLDVKLANYFEAVLKAADTLLLDLGIYTERGTSSAAESDPILKAAKSANPKEALLSLSARDQAEYLAKRQAATANRRM